MEATATGKGARIWLIAPDWRMRALVRAQLLEEGYDVTAVEDWAGLQARLRAEEVVPPRLVIAELTGDEPPAAFGLLRAFPSHRLVLRGAGAPPAETLRAVGIDAVLSRPSTIGEIVLVARALLAGANPRETERTPVTERP